MTLDHDSDFSLSDYIALVEAFWDGEVSQDTFTARALAMGADAETVTTVINNMRQMDGVDQ